jgi:hypothetical protein
MGFSSGPERPSGRARILFVLRSPAYVPNFESTLRLLDQRGHAVVLLFEEMSGRDQSEGTLVQRLERELRNLSSGPAGGRRWSPSRALAVAARVPSNYLRFYEPPFVHSADLRRRALPTLVRRADPLAKRLVGRRPALRRWLVGVARRLERRLPPCRHATATIRRLKADVVIVTPLVQFGSVQPDIVRAAQRLGIPSVLLLFSWDNLTNKGLMHATPDVVGVWNDAQRREARTLHGIPNEQIAVTGAPGLDDWFQAKPSSTRAEFFARLDLAVERPLIAYVCSSGFVAPQERAAVIRWIQGLREGADPLLARANVLIRPHPRNTAEWTVPLGPGLGPVAVFPLGGAAPEDEASRRDYRDTLLHASAVVGVNTSALIEAAIVDRPVLTLPSEFARTQDHLPHFAHLADASSGVVMVSRDPGEHHRQLANAMANPAHDGARRRAFVARFVRPRGLPVAATPVVVDLVESLLRGSEGSSLASPSRGRGS